MFIAHLPAGYLLTRYLQHKTHRHALSLRIAGLIASVVPDLDLLYFFLIDQRRTAHHHYITHWPLAWLALAATLVLFARARKRPQFAVYIGIALANVLLHMAMDSVAAEIYWLAPFSDMAVNLMHVTKHYDWWVLNFVLHWTFLLEILIVFFALDTWIADGKEHSHC